MYLEDLIKILEVIKSKYGDIPSYLLNKEYDLRIYVEKVEGEDVLIFSDETCKEVKEDYKDYKN